MALYEQRQKESRYVLVGLVLVIYLHHDVAGSSIYTCMLNERGGVESDLVYHVLSSSLSSDELQPQFEGKPCRQRRTFV